LTPTTNDDWQAVVLASVGWLPLLLAPVSEGGGRTRCVQWDFDVEDVVLDGGFHGR